MANKPSEFPTWTELEPAAMQIIMEKMPKYLWNVCEVLGIQTAKELEVSQETLFNIFKKVEQRRVYFHIFHTEQNGSPMQIGELNEGALFCFWILKQMPFRHNYYRNNILNVKIALCLFMNTLNFFAVKNGKKTNFTPSVIQDIYYAFIYRDLSKEAIMALAKSLVF
jgi:hypothetical protein